MGWDAEGRRDPELAVIVRLEVLWHYADHGVRLIIQRNLTTDDSVIAAVAAFPQFVAKNNDAVMSRLLIGCHQSATEDGRHTKQWKQIGCCHRSSDPLGAIAI